jgi:hypothetical protein
MQAGRQGWHKDRGDGEAERGDAQDAAEMRSPHPGLFDQDEWLIASYHCCCDLAGGIAPASTPYSCGTITPRAP